MFGWDRWILRRMKPLAPCLGIRGNIAKVGSLDLWYETFGNSKDPAVLLLMGGGCQGIFWTPDFCEKLSKLGLFVIRFDYRDTGLSSYFRTPYTLDDLAQDAVSLLDKLQISSAHLIGISMGGAIAQLLAVHHKERVKTISLLATSSDFRPLAAALSFNYDAKFPLPSPETSWITWLQEVEALPKLAFYKRLKKHLSGWKILNGSKAPFPEKYYFHLLAEGIKRQRSYKVLLNHRSAVVASANDLHAIEGKVKVPALIVHGKADPLFPTEHAKHMEKTIEKSRLIMLDDMGHNFCPCFHSKFLEEFDQFLQKQGA